MSIDKYQGYLKPHVDTIIEAHRRGMSRFEIACLLDGQGVQSYNVEAGATDREYNASSMVASIGFVLEKAGLTRRHVAKVKPISPSRRRLRPIDLDDGTERDRWHVWGPIEQYHEFRLVRS